MMMSVRERLHGHLGELTCTGVMFATGVFIAMYGLNYPLITSDGVVGPGVMPLVTGVALAVVTALAFVKTLRSTLTAAVPEPAAVPSSVVSLSDLNDEGSTGKPLTVAGILGMLVLSILLSPVFGLVPMLAVTVFVCVFIFERQRFLVSLLMAIGSGIVSWLLFVTLFEVPVPIGSFWALLGI